MIDTKAMGALGGALLLTALAGCASEPQHHRGGGFRGGPGAMRAGGAERPSVIVRPGALLLIDLDADHDLRISRAELEAGARTLFAAGDTNHDGSLSPLEFDALMQAHMGTSDATPGRLSFDANADNAITQAEFTAGLTVLFNSLDANGDGYVTRAELIQHFEPPAAAPEPGQQQPQDGGGYGGGRRGRRGGGYPGGG